MVRGNTCIALLRGINVGGRNPVPMGELRALAEGLGWRAVRTYVQSGNLVFEAAGKAAHLEQQLEAALERSLALAIPVIVRTAADWSRYAAGNPFPEASLEQPGAVMLALSKDPPRAAALAELRGRADAVERIEQVGDAIWVHYAAGMARSRLSPGQLDRAIGSPVTTRNWRTVVKLGELAAEAGS